MIRVATKEDSPTIKRFIQALIKDSKYTEVFKDYQVTDNMIALYTDPSTTDQKITIIVGNGIDDVGIGVFDIIPWYYNDVNLKLARLAYVYIEPDFRGKGFMKEINEAFEHWGKIVGANFYSKGGPGEGYVKTEEVYMKEVK